MAKFGFSKASGGLKRGPKISNYSAKRLLGDKTRIRIRNAKPMAGIGKIKI